MRCPRASGARRCSEHNANTHALMPSYLIRARSKPKTRREQQSNSLTEPAEVEGTGTGLRLCLVHHFFCFLVADQSESESDTSVSFSVLANSLSDRSVVCMTHTDSMRQPQDLVREMTSDGQEFNLRKCPRRRLKLRVKRQRI